MTEDKNTPLLQAILDQWPDHSKKTAIWPVFGATNLPTADGAKALKAMLGLSKLIVHRDADFMLQAEKDILTGKFKGSGCELWITEPSDVEGYFCTREHLMSVLEIGEDQAEDCLAEAWRAAKDAKSFRAKRSQINKDEKFYPGGSGTPSLGDAQKELDYHYAGSIKGKKLVKQLKALVHQELRMSPKLLLDTKVGGEIAFDLKEILDG
ncbi:hypothetical protein [Ruegeria halocynthiae]|uniref:hypothetical protein n=1 Tax=Ruegeria halocynthiae TaxID=985054 RepID=UPI001F177267|nr:hypothetical protein [Ruegeria halocynthiae]